MTAKDICLLQWNAYNARVQKVMSTLNEKNYFAPIMPGGNSPSWLMGHLADTDDKLLELFGIRSRMFPELEKIYHHDRNSNQSGHLAKEELNEKWKAVIAALDSAFNSMSEADWLGRHNAVTEEDFLKEPHRNKLNVMLSRVSHKASHLGQIAMMVK
jgi:DinB superfamily